jgi:LDH2 family malate/lactate/ureidoglycolate dehydrogenase
MKSAGAQATGRVSAEWLSAAVSTVFRAAGLSADASDVVARALVDADLRGVPSHGTMLVPMYIGRIRAGSVSTKESARVVTVDGAVAVLDGEHALGQLTSDQAMALAVAKAKQYGVGAVAVRHAFHFGGAFRYVEQAAAQGCIGVAASNTRPLMPGVGGAAPVVGNNPLAFGVPRPDGPPIVLDMALSEAALGKIRLAAQAGREIPATWATDRDGSPTTDPQAAIEGMLLPAAGHKGFGLALIVDLLTGVLAGGAFGSSVRGLYADLSVPNDCAQFFLALDVSKFVGIDGFSAGVAELARQVLESPTAPGVDRVMLPGQPETERYAGALVDGIAVGAEVLAALEQTAAEVGAVLPELPTDVVTEVSS